MTAGSVKGGGGRGPCVAGTGSVGDKLHLLSEPGYQGAGVVLMAVLEGTG